MNFKELTSRCTKHIATKGLNTIRYRHVTAETLTVRGAHEGKIQKFIERWRHPGLCWETFCSNHNV